MRAFLLRVVDYLGDLLDDGAFEIIDAEANACESIAIVLEGLELEQRDRVLRWAKTRYQLDDDAMLKLYAEREAVAAARRHALVMAEMKFRAEIASLYDEIAWAAPTTSH